jgi:hypothetical protein
MNPHIYAVTGHPRRPQDQGSVESMNKLVKRILGTVLTERRLAGDNPNWTEVLGMVAATINSQHGRGKDDVSSFEAVYDQVLNHDMSCSKAEARQCWTLSQFLKVTNDAEFAEYAANNYNLDEDSPDAAEQDDSSGYFSDEELQDDEKEEVTDDDFFNLLNQNILDNDTVRKRPPEEEHLNLEKTNDFAEDTGGLVNDATMFDAEVSGHWQGDAGLGGDANYEDYNQIFEVDEQHNTSTTPEKKHFKSDEVDSPEVTPLSEFLTTPPQEKERNDEDDEEVYDVWDKSWVYDAAVDQRTSKTSLTAGFGAYSIAEAWEWQSQFNRKVENDDCVVARLYCDRCTRSGMPGILIPNSRYEHELRYSTKWYISGFIAGFAAVIQHDAHITTPKYKNTDRVLMVFTPYPNNPVNEILPYGSTTHFVSVVWNRQHYAVLYYNIDKRSVTVFDGLNHDIRKWQDHVIHTVKTYGLKPLFSSATFEFRDKVYVDERVRKRTQLETRDMALEIHFDDLKDESWHVQNKQSYVQDDGVSCGPIACLKLIEIYGVLPVGSIETIGESAPEYRHVVMDFYNECISRYNDVFKVEIRTKKFLRGKQPQSEEDPIKARTVEAPQSGCFPIETRTVEARQAAMLAVPSPTARGKQPLSEEDPIKARTVEAPQSGCFPIETRTVEARQAAMLAVPSPTARVQLLGQLNCDWVTQCCVRKEETPDHCTFGLDSSSRQCTRPVHFECQLAWETYAKLSHKKKCSSKVCREHHPQYQHWQEEHLKPVEGT